MVYSNDASNADYYSSISREVYSYPPPPRMSAIETEGTYNQTYAGPIDQRGTIRQSGPSVRSPTSPRTTGSFEPVAPTTSSTSWTDGHWPSYDWTADYLRARSHHSGYLNRDPSFTNTATSETPTTVHTPRRGEHPHRSQVAPLDYGGANRNGASTSTFSMGNLNTSHRQRAGQTGPEMTQGRRYHPYEMPRTRLDSHRNAEAGPSTLAAPSVPHVGRPTTQPSGGISERRADAQTTHSITENLRAAPMLTRTPNGYGEPRPTREKSEEVGRELCGWVQQRGTAPPTFNQALAVAAMIVRKKRVPVHPKPCLKKGMTERKACSSKSAKIERERRRVERILYQNLSRYYSPPKGKEWVRSQLLVKAFDDVKRLEKDGDLEDIDFKDIMDLEDREAVEDLEDLEGLDDLRGLEDIPALPTLPEPSNESPP